MMTNIHKGLVIFVALFIVLSSPALNAGEASAQTEPPTQQAEPAVGEELGYGFGSVLASMLYSPLKITYAGLGLMTGGLGYVLSAGRGDVANNIIYPSVRGNYVITPSHLKGEQPVIFIGAPPPEDSQPKQTSSAAPATR